MFVGTFILRGGSANMINRVFTIQGVPEHTYISRIEQRTGFTYEMRLNQAIRIKGILVCITGPDNVGKRTLCRKVFGQEHTIEAKLNEKISEESFWKHVLGAANCYDDCIAENILQKDVVLDLLKNKVLVIEGYGLLKDKMKTYVAQQVKDVVRWGIRIALILKNGEERQVLAANPDLQGRVNLIRVDFWTEEELEKIAIEGLKALGITDEKAIIQRMAKESNGQPGIMQRLCLEKYKRVMLKEI